MSVTPSPIGGFAAQFFDNNGVILSGGKIYTYAAGTTTPQATYTSASGVTPHANPIILDSAGRVPGGEIWLTDGLVYKFVIETATGSLLGTYDNITGVNSNFVNYTVQEEVITATAGQTVFNLSTINYTPGTNSLTVYIDGVNQYVGDSYLETDSDTVTFTSGVHVGGEVKFTTAIQTTTGAVDASIVSYDPPFTGGVLTNVEDKLAQYVSVKDFGAVGDGVTDDYGAIDDAWQYCYPLGVNLYFPSGTYLVTGDQNFPFRNTQSPVTSLLDCNDMTIYGDGPSTILKTSSVTGADVLQLNGLKNFHVRNLQLQAVISGSVAGSNGISVTGGFDNITVDNVWAKDLAYVDATTYVDGGKAVTIQPPTEANAITMGLFKATNVYADGCVYGFGYEPDNDLAAAQPVSIDVDIVASNCRQGVVFSAAASTSAISADSTSGVRIRAQTVNCMQDVVAARSLGIDVECQIVQTKTTSQLLLSYDGNPWLAADTVADVIGVIAQYTKNSRFVISGNKKACQHKALIGGASDPSSGLSGNTNYCDFYLDINGAAVGVDVQFADAGGNIMNNSRIYCTSSTATSLPIEFYTPSLDNSLTIGPDTRLKSLAVTSQVGWTETDGRTVLHKMSLSGGNLSTQQLVGSGGSIIIQQWANQAGATQFAVRNDGYIVTAGRASASAVATIKGVLPIYDETNTLYGYVPVYTTYS